MTELVSLDDIRAHLRLEEIETDDAMLIGMIVAARRICEQRIRRSVADMGTDDLAVLRQAIKLLVGDWYRNRESGDAGDGQLPAAVRWVLHPIVSMALD